MYSLMMMLFQQQHLSASIIVGCSTLSLITACHANRHNNLLLDRLKTETFLSTNLNTLLTQQDLNSVHSRLEYGKINEQIILLKEMIEEKRICIDEMNSLLQNCNEIHHNEVQMTALCNRMKQYLTINRKAKSIKLIPQPHINNEMKMSDCSISSNQVNVAQRINFFEQKT